jgi:WD40 repeat protein
MIYLLLATVPFFALQQPLDQKMVLVDEDIRPDRIHLSRDGTTLAVSGGRQKGGDWKIFDLATGKVLVDGGAGTLRSWGAWAVRLSDDKSLLAVGGNYNNFFLVDAKTGKLVWNLTKAGHVGVIHHLRFTPDGKYLISAANDMMIRVWDIPNKKAQAVFRFTSENPGFNLWKILEFKEPAKQVYHVDGKYSVINDIDLSPDGKTLAVGGSIESKVVLLDLASGKISNTIETKFPRTGSVQFTEDGKWLLISGCQTRNGEKGSMEIWDLEKNESVRSFGAHANSGGGILSPDKKTVIANNGFDGFRVWDVATGKQKFSYFAKDDPRLPRETKPHPKDGSKFVLKYVDSAGAGFLPDGKTFYYVPAGWIRTEIYFHDTATGKPVDYRKRVAALPKAPR